MTKCKSNYSFLKTVKKCITCCLFLSTPVQDVYLYEIFHTFWIIEQILKETLPSSFILTYIKGNISEI